MEGTFRLSNTLLSPVKGYPQSNEPKAKQETKYANIYSPYPQDIKTPMKDSEWDYYQKRVNGETPIINSRIFSPILSSNQQKIGYGTYSIHPRMLFNDCSPFKPQVVLSTPYHNNQSTVDNNQSKENKNDFSLFQCKNLATQFDSVLNNELSLIEKNESLFNDIDYAIPSIQFKEKEGGNDSKETQTRLSTIVCFGKLNYDLYQSFNKQQDEEDKDESEEGIDEVVNSNDEAGEYEDHPGKAINYKNNARDIITKREGGGDCLDCKCTKSQCLKLYCECFANGKYCNGCVCVNCLNTIEYEAYRRKAYNKIITKNPKALQKIQSNKKSWTCKCKNSSCQKNYCDCYQNDKFCSSKCKCFDCKNKPSNKRQRGNIKTNKKPILSHIKRKKKNREEAYGHVTSTSHYDAIYTPQKKSYRAMKPEFQNSILTAAHTALSANKNPKRSRSNQRNQSLVCKRLDMKDEQELKGLF